MLYCRIWYVIKEANPPTSTSANFKLQLYQGAPNHQINFFGEIQAMFLTEKIHCCYWRCSAYHDNANERQGRELHVVKKEEGMEKRQSMWKSFHSHACAQPFGDPTVWYSIFVQLFN